MYWAPNCTVQYSTVQRLTPQAAAPRRCPPRPSVSRPPPSARAAASIVSRDTCPPITARYVTRDCCPPITAHLADDAEAGSVPRGVEARRLLPRVLGHAVHEHRVLAAAARHPEPDQSEASAVPRSPPITAHLSWAGSCTQPAAALGPGMLAALCHAPCWPRCRLYTSARATPPSRPPTM